MIFFQGSPQAKESLHFPHQEKNHTTEIRFEENDALLFGPETRGLPKKILERRCCKDIVRVPMKKNSRSLNLSNTVSVVAYEAMRQLGFPGLV